MQTLSKEEIQNVVGGHGGAVETIVDKAVMVLGAAATGWTAQAVLPKSKAFYVPLLSGLGAAGACFCHAQLKAFYAEKP